MKHDEFFLLSNCTYQGKYITNKDIEQKKNIYIYIYICTFFFQQSYITKGGLIIVGAVFGVQAQKVSGSGPKVPKQ